MTTPMIRRFRSGIALMLCTIVFCCAGALSARADILRLPSGLRVIEQRAFFRATALDEVTLSEGATEIRSEAFALSTLRRITLPLSLTFIADDAFEGCGQLYAIVPQNSYALAYCERLGIANNQTDPLTPHIVTGALSQDSYTLTVGGRLALDGQVTALSGTLGRVSLAVSGFASVNHEDGRLAAKGLSSSGLTTCRLSDYSALTLNGAQPPFNAPGRYILQLWARTKDGVDALMDTAVVKVLANDIAGKTDYSDVIWSALTQGWGFTAAQAAGIMGNIYAESTYCPRNAEDTKYPGLDNGKGNLAGNLVYTYDVNDAIGYGICQWTYPSRKRGLLAKAKAMNSTVHDIAVQLAFLKDELDSYNDIRFTDAIRKMTRLEDVSDLILKEYEEPPDIPRKIEERRGYGREAYKRYTGRDYVTPTANASPTETR